MTAHRVAHNHCADKEDDWFDDDFDGRGDGDHDDRARTDQSGSCKFFAGGRSAEVKPRLMAIRAKDFT